MHQSHTNQSEKEMELLKESDSMIRKGYGERVKCPNSFCAAVVAGFSIGVA